MVTPGNVAAVMQPVRSVMVMVTVVMVVGMKGLCTWQDAAHAVVSSQKSGLHPAVNKMCVVLHYLCDAQYLATAQ